MRQALAAVCGVIVLAGCGGDAEPASSDDTPAASESTTSITPTEPEPEPAAEGPAGVTVTEVPDGPVGLTAFGDSAVWAALPGSDAVWVDEETQVPVGSLPLRLVATPAGVWVSLIGDAEVALIDVETGKVAVRTRLRPATSEPEGLAYDGRSLWVVDQAGDRVLELDPATGAVRAEHPTGHEPRLVTTGPSGTFVGDYTGGTVTRVADGEATTRNAGSCLSPQGLAEAAGIVWVACTVDGQVVGLDAGTLKPVAELPGLDSADAVVADGDTVYVVGQEGPTVWTIDARTHEVTGELVLDGAAATTENVGVALLARSLVVSHPDAGRLYDVPLRLLR